MSSHGITISRVPGGRAVDTTAVTLASGDTVTFTADAKAGSTLCLNADTAGIISPPGSTSVAVAGGSSVTLTLGTVAPGNYCINVYAEGWAPSSPAFDTGANDTVLRIKCPKSDYSGPDDAGTGGTP